MGRPMFLHNVPHRRRRASGDRSEKLNPIDPSTSVASNSSQSSSPDAQTRCSDSVGSLGDESTSSSGMQGGSAESARATTAARQLDSVVDETCAEV